MEPIYIVLGNAVGYLLAQLVRYVGRSRFWRLVARKAQRYIEDPTDPITDPREAVERALIEAQRAQLDRVERDIHGGGNGMRLSDDDDTPRNP